jgi:hypothetical protein
MKRDEITKALRKKPIEELTDEEAKLLIGVEEDGIQSDRHVPDSYISEGEAAKAKLRALRAAATSQSECAEQPTTAMPNYRSPLKRAIRAALVANHDASDLEICGWLDDEQEIPVPKSYRKAGAGTFKDAYRNHPRLKDILHSTISPRYVLI